jgi:hypothetical protein
LGQTLAGQADPSGPLAELIRRRPRVGEADVLARRVDSIGEEGRTRRKPDTFLGARAPQRIRGQSLEQLDPQVEAAPRGREAQAAARELLETGTYGFWAQAAAGTAARDAAFD